MYTVNYILKIVKYDTVTDDEVMVAFKLLCRTEEIMSELESSHVIAYVFVKLQKNYGKDKVMVVNLSGRGDKDLEIIL